MGYLKQVAFLIYNEQRTYWIIICYNVRWCFWPDSYPERISLFNTAHSHHYYHPVPQSNQNSVANSNILSIVHLSLRQTPLLGKELLPLLCFRKDQPKKSNQKRKRVGNKRLSAHHYLRYHYY